MLEIRTLGGLAILDNGEQVTSFDQRKVPALLVYLAATGRPHPREVLAEFFWEERTTARSLKNLSVALVDLKKKLGGYIAIIGDAVSLNPACEFWLDAAEFERLTQDSNDVERLAAALSLYKGGFLDGFAVESCAFDLWTTGERERLHMRMANAYDHLIEYHFQNGDYAAGIDHALRFLAMEPGRERTYWWLMKLLACCGEREKALERFAACCQALSEMKLSPSPATLALYERIRAGDDFREERPLWPGRPPVSHQEAAGQQLARESPPDVACVTPHRESAVLVKKTFNIPSRARRLVGRGALIDEINQALDQGERVLLQGFAGIGKTALAAEVLASRNPSDDRPALWLELGCADVEALLEALVRPLDAAPALAAASNARDQVVRDALHERRISLVVYDNAWDGRVLDQLIAVCPDHIPVIATSRERFPVGKILRITELSLDDALELLSVHTYQAFTRDDRAALELCKKLGGHPLAIKIAGRIMQVDEIGPGEMLRRIGDAPDSLPDPLRPDEGAPVATLIATSLEGLDPVARNVFLSFGTLFTTTATPDLLALCTDLTPERAERALETLNRRGLAERSCAVDSIPLFRVHDLAYAYTRAEATLDAVNVIAACATYAARHAASLNALDAEIGNLIGAAELASQTERYDGLVAILRALAVDAQYFEARGYGQHLLGLLEEAAAAAKALGELEAAHYLYARLGNAYSIHLSQFPPAIAAYTEALDLARWMEDHTRQAMMLTLLGTTRFRQGSDDPDSYYEQAYALAAEYDDPDAMAFLLSHRSYYAAQKNPPDHERSVQYSDEAVALARRVGNAHTLWASLLSRASSERPLGRIESALETDREALQLARDCNNRVWEAGALFGLGEDFHALGDRDQAQTYLSAALRLYRQNGEEGRAARLIAFMQKNDYPVDAEDER